MKTAFVLKGYPRLSETFIAQEIRALEKRGLDIQIVSLRHPTDKYTHPIHDEIEADVLYLPEYLHNEPSRVLKAWRRVHRKSGYKAAQRIWRQDLARDRTRNRIRRFGQAIVLASELENKAEHLHFHFLHTPASVTRYAAMIMNIPWSGSAHAKDIWTISEWEKREKLSDMSWLSTCTASGADHLRSLAGTSPEKVHLDYHGLDLSRFPEHGSPSSSRDGHHADEPVRILSVGRAVEKKGYGDLLNALAKLPPSLKWQFRHIGGGALKNSLEQQAETCGISDRVEWMGAQPQQVVLDEIRQADLFVLASKVAADGDRDGLPNVLMEAQSQGLAVLSTSVSAVPELIKSGETGTLVPPGDTEALAEALQTLIENPAHRNALARAGEQRVRSNFDADLCITGLADRFGLANDT